MIDREHLIKLIDDACAGCARYKAEDIADHLLSNDLTVARRGHWMTIDDGWGGTYYTCSACKCDWCTIDGTPDENNMRYCPECGAKMDALAEREGKG